MEDSNGKQLATSNDVIKEAVKVYKERFKNREINDDLKDFQTIRERLCEKRLKKASSNKKKPWDLDDLLIALSDLKINKSRDPMGLINETFKPKVSGPDIQKSLLLILNKI